MGGRPSIRHCLARVLPWQVIGDRDDRDLAGRRTRTAQWPVAGRAAVPDTGPPAAARSSRPVQPRACAMDITKIIDTFGYVIYAALAVLAVWGVYNAILLYRGLAKKALDGPAAARLIG